MTGTLLIVLAYLIGSFPSALIIGKGFFRKDIRQFGSGNLGSTNAYRVLGKYGGTAVLVLDIGKGTLAAYLASRFVGPIHPLIISIFALIGHIYPLFAGFRGGKAVATAGGIIIYFLPAAILLLLSVFVISLRIWKLVSLSSSLMALSLILIAWFGGNWGFFGHSLDTTSKVMLSLFGLLIIFKHIPNYKRMWGGTENKVRF
ncbi:MAG: glycerol-3-phosphate 1-O-acyltransferase PlsY [Turicibacter sp.]|nr:glycerol-3-phosphate 1-O-acyltransferase PlsY [Turicibacter sp.]